MPERSKTREEWLETAVDMITPLFEAVDLKVPKNIKVSCGFPSKNAFSAKNRRVAECWYPSASKGKKHEIFISPLEEDSATVLDHLCHEMVHTLFDVKVGHKREFVLAANKVGLTEGKPATIGAGPELMETLKRFAKTLGRYPHHSLSQMTNGKKPGRARLLKAVCECGYVIRVTKKWVDAVGLPTCPCGNDFELED